MRRTWLILLLLTLLPALAQAATRYVDTTCGNVSTYVPTTRACTGGSAVTRNTVAAGVALTVAGDILQIRGGTYSVATIIPNSGTSWSNPVTIKRFGSETVTFTINPFRLKEVGQPVAYVIFDGLIYDCVSCAAGSAVDGINISAASGPIRHQNGTVRNSTGSGIVVGEDAAPGNEFINMHVHNIGSSAFHHGFYIFGSNTLVDRCHIHDTQGHGIKLGQAETPQTGNIARNNTIHDFVQHGDGVSGAGGIAFAFNNNNSFAYNNVIYNCDAAAGGEPSAGIYNWQGSNNAIYHNTIYGMGSNCSSIYLSPHITNIVARNNIFNSGSPIVLDDASASTANVNTNLCASAGTGCTVIGNPLFVDSAGGKVSLQLGSPAINAGANLTAIVPTDIAGVARPQGAAVDIGAYEFSDAPQPEPLPEAIYTFDNTGNDATGHGHTGTLVGGATFTTAPIVGTHALQLTNVGDYVTVPSSAALRTQQWTIAGWVNMTTTDTEGCIWAGVGEEFGGWITPAGNATCYINATTYVELNPITPVLTGTNRHLACTYDGSVLRGYVDGISVGTATTSQTLAYNGSERLFIGQYQPGGAFNCKGRIDQVYVYPAVSTPEGITNLFNEQVPPSSGGLSVTHQAWYAANAAQGQQLGTTDTDRIDHGLTMPLAVRWAIHKSDVGSLTEYFRPYCRVKSTGGAWGAWTEVGNSFGTLGVRYLQDTVISQGDATSVLLPLDGFTGIAGKVLENPIDTTVPYADAQRMTIAQGQHAELEIRIEFGSPLVAGDQVQCRPYRETGVPFDSYGSIIPPADLQESFKDTTFTIPFRTYGVANEPCVSPSGPDITVSTAAELNTEGENVANVGKNIFLNAGTYTLTTALTLVDGIVLRPNNCAAVTIVGRVQICNGQTVAGLTLQRLINGASNQGTVDFVPGGTCTGATLRNNKIEHVGVSGLSFPGGTVADFLGEGNHFEALPTTGAMSSATPRFNVRPAAGTGSGPSIFQNVVMRRNRYDKGADPPGQSGALGSGNNDIWGGDITFQEEFFSTAQISFYADIKSAGVLNSSFTIEDSFFNGVGHTTPENDPCAMIQNGLVDSEFPSVGSYTAYIRRNIFDRCVGKGFMYFISLLNPPELGSENNDQVWLYFQKNIIISTSSARLALDIQRNQAVVTGNVIIDGEVQIGNTNNPSQHSVTFQDNILSGVVFDVRPGGGFETCSHNDFYLTTGVAACTSSITTNPLFVNPASDWHLQSSSPARTAGSDGREMGVYDNTDAPWLSQVQSLTLSAPAAPTTGPHLAGGTMGGITLR